MKYPNAYEGLKKLFVAEILLVVVAAGGVAVQIMTASALKAGSEIPSEAASVATLCMIVTIAGYIVNLLGLNQAGKDEAFFRTAFMMALLTVAASVASSVLTAIGYDSAQSIAATIGELLQIFIIIYTIYGIGSLAEKSKSTDLAQLSRKLLMLIPAILFISMAVRLVGGFSGGKIADETVETAAAVAVLAAHIIYMVLLGKAAKTFGRK